MLKTKKKVSKEMQLKHSKGDVTTANMTIIGGDSSNIFNDTHAVLYIARRFTKTTKGDLVELDPCLRKIGYCQVLDSLLTEVTYNNQSWRQMVAKRISEYNNATGGNHFWIVDEIIIAPRGVVGNKTQVDKDVQEKLYGNIGVEFGKNQDLIDLDFKNKVDDIKDEPKKLSKYLRDKVIKLFNQEPNSIELDLAQAIQVALIAYAAEEYYKEHGSLNGFMALLFDAPRSGKTLLTIMMGIELFAKKYGFTRIVFLNWVLTANTSYYNVIYNWQQVSRDQVNLVDTKNPTYSNTKINIDICSAHGSLDTFKKRYTHMEGYQGNTLLIRDEFDEGLTCKNQKEKADWINATSAICCTGSGIEKATSAYSFDCMESIAFVEPAMFNSGTHPYQTDWYHLMPKSIVDVIDAYKNYTPGWSERRVKWNVGDMQLSQDAINDYAKISETFDKSVLLTMSKFLHSDNNKGMRKDFYTRMLVGSQPSIGASVLNCGIELSSFIGYQPWTVLIDIEAVNNKQFDNHVQEFNSWAVSEIKCIGIAVNGDSTDYTKVEEQLYNLGIEIEIPKKFSNSTTEKKMNLVCNQLHSQGYKVIFFSKGMGFKSNSCEYIEVVVHMRDGGSIDVRYQAGARSTTPGLRFNGKDYVQKTDGYDIYVSLSTKAQANLMKQTINGMCQDTNESINRNKPQGAPDFDEKKFFNSIGVFSNETGSVKKLSIEEAYRYANTPEVVSAMLGSQAMLIADDLDQLSDDSFETLNLMFEKNGNTRFKSGIAGNKTGGKSSTPKPKKPSNNPPKNTDAEKKQLMESLSELIRNFISLLGSTVCLADDMNIIDINVDNIDIYSILIKLDDEEEVVDAFGASGKSIVKLFTEISSIGVPLLKSVTLTNIAMRQLEEI